MRSPSTRPMAAGRRRPGAAARVAALLFHGFLASCAAPVTPPPASATRTPVESVPANAERPTAARADVMEEAMHEGGLSPALACRLAEVAHEPLLFMDETRAQALLRGDLAQAARRPEVSLLFAFDRQNSVNLGGAGGFNSAEVYRSQWSLRVVQPLFEGFRRLHQARVAGADAAAASALREDLLRALRGAVSRAWFEAAEAEAEIGAREEALRLDDARLDEMRARMEQGLSRRTEVLLLESRRETTRADLIRARARRDESRALLRFLTGTDVDLPLPAPTEPGGPATEIEDAVVEALRTRPDARAADRRIEAAREALGIASADHWPTLDATGNWYLDRHNYSDFQEETRWEIGVDLEVPLFRGGAVRVAERMAQSRLRQEELNRSHLRRSIRSEVESARLRLFAGRALLATLDANERFARENLDLVLEEFRQGLATNLEVFTAQNLQQDAAVARERQRLRTHLEDAEFALAIGRHPFPQTPDASEEEVR